MIYSASDLIRLVRGVATDVMRGARQAFKSSVDSAYSSGNPKTKRPGEASAANLTKKVLIAYGVASPAASDSIIEFSVGDGTVIAKIGDAGGATDSDLWNGVTWATPGATTTLLSANTEQNTASASYVTVKSFNLSFPGRYRVTCELARSNVSTEAKLVIELVNGNLIDASTVETSTTTYPSFSSHTLDMNVTANFPGTILHVQYKASGTTAYIKNVVVKYSDATATPTLYSAVLLD